MPCLESLFSRLSLRRRSISASIVAVSSALHSHTCKENTYKTPCRVDKHAGAGKQSTTLINSLLILYFCCSQKTCVCNHMFHQNTDQNGHHFADDT